MLEVVIIFLFEIQLDKYSDVIYPTLVLICSELLFPITLIYRKKVMFMRNKIHVQLPIN